MYAGPQTCAPISPPAGVDEEKTSLGLNCVKRLHRTVWRIDRSAEASNDRVVSINFR